MEVSDDFRGHLASILAAPTAPFAEAEVHRRISAFVRASPGLRESFDRYGNHLVVMGPGRPALLFACHTDHPALVSNGDGTASILGGMRPKALAGARVREMDAEGARGTVGGRIPGRKEERLRLRLDRRVPKGRRLVLDLPGPRFSGGKIRARAIDDLCAVAACLTTFQRLRAARWRGTVGALFTRAEEVGFAGALGFVRATTLPRSTLVVNLEMSSERKHAPQGKGPILRVGDRITTFDPGVSEALEDVARSLEAEDRSFRWQRALMDGGACEATVYAHAGFRAGALCLPLRNYHNHAPSGRMGMEYVDAADAEHLVRWMVAIAKALPARRGSRRVARRLDELWSRRRAELLATAAQGRAR